MKAQIFFATMSIISVVFFIDTYRAMYDPIFNIDGLAVACVIFLIGFGVTTTMSERKK